jgi:hypothetical protein
MNPAAALPTFNYRRDTLSFVILLFDVVRNKKNGNWEIDGIEIE